jgi:hypothetical protein
MEYILKNKKQKYYTFPNSNISMEKIQEYFGFLINEYEYKIISEDAKEYNAVILYENKKIYRNFGIENRTNYTDYGYSIFFYIIQTQNILKENCIKLS